MLRARAIGPVAWRRWSARSASGPAGPPGDGCAAGGGSRRCLRRRGCRRAGPRRAQRRPVGGRRGCSRSAADPGCGRHLRLGLAQLFQVGVEQRLLVGLELVAIAIGGLQVLGGQSRPDSSPSLAVLKRRDPASRYLIGGTGGGCRVAEEACGRVIGGCPGRGTSPCAQDQDETDRSKPSQRDLLSPLATTAADVPGDGLMSCHHKWETISPFG